MPLDINKIDERIKKLQELRKIAADPEMSLLLSEFLVGDNGLTTPAAPQAPAAAQEALPHGDEVSDFVKGVLEGTDTAPRGGPAPGWNARKA